MARILVLASAFGICAFLGGEDALAHGGSSRGPGGVAAPPSGDGEVGGGSGAEPDDPEGGPSTPPEGGPETAPGGGAPPPSSGGPSQGPRRPATKSLTLESWRFWWGYNNDPILNPKLHIHAHRTASTSPLHFASRRDEQNRRDAKRPTERAIRSTIIPALMRTMNRAGDHEDIHGGAMVALGKVGSAKHIEMLKAAASNRYRNDKGAKLEFGYQATESAVLALGLLPDMDEDAKASIRRFCLEAIADETLRTRERAWAAVCLGLQQDEKAVLPLMKLLEMKYPDDNVPAGILCGLGLIGSEAPLEMLEHAFLKGRMGGRRISSDRIRAFVGYAIQKIGLPSALPTINRALTSRKLGRIVKRTAAIAAGVLGRKADSDAKVSTTQALMKYLRTSGGDPSGENFALIALSQVGTDRGLAHLLKIAENGKHGQRPFAGLGLATHVFYNDREAAQGRAEPMDAALRRKIVEKLAACSGEFKDPDMKAAFFLARGLVKDRSAIEDMVAIATHKGANPVLRGYCCVGLGLIGDATDTVKDALKLVMRERSSTDLRRDAATGLGLLRDADVIRLLLDEMTKTRSFALQVQLITAIGTIGDHTAIDPLVRILDDRTQRAPTRAMAAVGLGMIGDLRPIPALARVSLNYNYRASVPDLDELLYIM